MRYALDTDAASNNNGLPGRRASSRYRQSGLSCNVGEVLDLSTSGARLRCRHVPQGTADLVFTNYTRSGQLLAEIVWSRPVGAFHYDVGLRFPKVSRELRTRLQSIAMNHRFRRAG